MHSTALSRRSRSRSLRMMTRRIGVVVLLLLGLTALSSTTPVHAQETTPEEQLYRVEMNTGEVLVGTIVSEDDEEVVLRTEQLGEVTFKRANIESIEKVDPGRIRDGEYWFPNPQSTRYLFAPNAIGIPKGKGYYQNTWVLFNNVNYGVSNNFSIGAGTVPIFLFGAEALPLWVLPKVSVSTPQQNLHVAGGALLGGVVGEGGGGLGLLYGNATVGSRDHNATIGLGYGYVGDEISDTPAVNISGMTRIGKKTYLISENYFFPDAGVVSLGLRWAPENFALDVALFRPLEDTGGLVAWPWLGVTVPFGG